MMHGQQNVKFVLQMLKHVSIHTDTKYHSITLTHISLLIWITDLLLCHFLPVCHTTICASILGRLKCVNMMGKTF